jgi:UDP-galactopyranose mutase
MLDSPNIDVKLNVDFFDVREKISPNTQIIYSGPIDQYFDYKFGRLEYRTLKFETEVVPYEDYQGTSVMNYADLEVPFTRIHEPRHLHPERIDYPSDKSLIIREYSMLDDGTNPYYPINDQRNQDLIVRYREEIRNLSNVRISGRLGEYKYFDMHDTINHALEMFEEIKGDYSSKPEFTTTINNGNTVRK